VESGELEVNRGGEIIRAGKGDVVYLPKNIPHAPRIVGREDLQVLVICVPGGFDHYFAACAEEWSKPEPNLQYLDEIAARFGQEFHSLYNFVTTNQQPPAGLKENNTVKSQSFIVQGNFGISEFPLSPLTSGSIPTAEALCCFTRSSGELA